MWGVARSTFREGNVMATTCAVCKRSHTEELCPYCTVTDVKISELTDKLHLQHGGDGNEVPTAFLVDLVSNRKIPITTPRCKVGRDDLNDIVISGDQSISRFHFVITKDSDQYMVQDSKSRHGTFLNGNQIAGPIPINDGDVLKVGVSLFWFVIENQSVGGGDQFSPVDIGSVESPAESQEVKVSANEKTTPYAPTRETDVSSMTSLKEVLAQAKAKEGSFNEEEMSKTIAPKDAQKAKDSVDKVEAEEEKEEKSSEKAEEEADDKADSKDAKDNKDSKDSKDSKDDKDDKDEKSESEIKESKSKKDAKEDKDDKEEKNSEKKEDPSDTSDKKEEGLQITASMLMEALEHESLSEVSKLDDKPSDKDKESESASEKETAKQNGKDNGKDKSEEAESKDKGKKNKKEDDQPSEKDLQGLFSDNGNLDKTSEEKEPASSNDKEQETSSSDKITDSEAEKAPEDKSNEEDFSPGKPESDAPSVSKSTLDKMADAVQEMSGSDTESKDKDKDLKEEKAEDSKSNEKGEESEKSESVAANKEFEQEIVEKTKNGAWSGNTMQDTKVPDWCSKYFASELNLLVKDLDNLNEQVRNAQTKIKEVENRLAATKSLRNTLLTATGEDLVEACGKVLARLGWRVKIVEDDKQELRLESDDKVSICRIIWTQGLPERTHLGQLSIAQTRYWCEQGAEPKGILIAAQAEDKPPPKITDTDYSGELADYASKKNVLMLTTLQLLAMYKEIALNEGSAEALRSSIHTSNGWLKGYSLDPSDEDEKEPNKLASASA